MPADEFTTDRWIELEGLRIRIEPGNGTPLIKEICALTDDGSIDVKALRRVTKRAVTKVLDPGVGARQRNAAVYGRGRHKEDLLALVAISYEEFTAAGDLDPALKVHRFLAELHLIESGPEYEHEPVVGRPYTRSSVRTLIREAHRRGYWRKDDDGQVHLGACSTTATLRIAEKRKTRFFPEPVENISESA